MDKEQALHSFWSSFDLPAYDSRTVKPSAQLPYITYDVSLSSFEEPVIMSASLWYNSTSWADISQKADEISEEIGAGGKIISFDDGFIWITRGTPFAQRMSDPDTAIRRILLNTETEYLSEN